MRDFRKGDVVKWAPPFDEKFGPDVWIVEGTVPYDGSIYSKGYKQVACDPRMLILVKGRKQND